MSDLREEVGRRIAALRKAHGLSQDAAAAAAEMSRRYLGAVERGESAASLDTIERIARAIGVPVARFFELAPQERADAEPADRLASVARSLAAGVAAEHVKRAERVLRAYFKDVDPKPAKRTAKTKKKAPKKRT